MKDENFKPKLIYRKRIENKLSKMFDVPIFFVFAPMGYGKTTAVRRFLERNKQAETIWFDIGNEANDDVWLWQKFCSTMKITDSHFSKKLRKYGFPKSVKRIYRVIDLIRCSVTNNTVIVMDDWRDGNSTYLNNFIKALALHSIPDLHIVMISRYRPASEYVELELKQKCIMLQQEDMAFKFDETVELFKINGIELSEEEAREVYEYTGGWVSATYLSMFRYIHEGNFKDIPKATELIKTAVYNKFDSMTKDTLLKLSLLDNFTLEQAIFITNNRECSSVIKNLVDNNCFIKYNSKLRVYTLHFILKTALQDEILINNIDVSYIYNKCGDWYYENGENVTAISYYYKANNFQRVLDLIEDGYTIELTNLRQSIINSVFAQLTLKEKINRPIAYLTYIFFYILYENPVDGSKLLYEAKEIYETGNELKSKRAVLGEIAFLESLLMFDDVKKMTAYHKKAYELFDGGTSQIANNRMPVTFGSPHFICLFHKKPGQLKEIIDYFEQAVEYFIHISNGGGAGVNYLMKAEYYFEIGECQKGKIYAYKALSKANSKKQTSIVLCALFLIVRIHIFENDMYNTRKYYNELIDEVETVDVPSWLNGTIYAKTYINAIMGNYKAIPDNITQVDDYEFEQILPIVSTKYIAQGLAIIYEHDYIKLDIHADIMIGEQKNSIFTLIYAYIYKAISQYQQHNLDRAKRFLLTAIDLAKQDHLVMCFVELSPHIIFLLRAIQKKEEYIKEILPSCEKYYEEYKNNSAIYEKVDLTPREIQIMQLVDKGYKQAEISERLNIALITVKKHISSVYSKLNVENKTKALNLLKEKGII